MSWKWGEKYADLVVISGRDLLTLIIIFVLLFGLGFKSLSQSIQGDESAYLMMAFGHAIKFFLKFGDYFPLLDSLPAKYLIQFISLILVVGVILFIYVSRMLAWPIRILVVLGAMLSCRLIIMHFGGNPSPHPPLAGATHLIFGAIFGVNSFALKSAYFFAYVLFVFGIYKIAIRRIPSCVSLLLALSAGTIPLTLHLGAIVESSVWSLICFTLLMLELVTKKDPNFIRLASFISLITLFRQSSFIGYVPLLIVVLASIRKPYFISFKNVLPSIIAPSILFIPFLIQSLLYGTPSTKSLGQESGQLNSIIQVLLSGVVLAAVGNSVSKLWIFFLPFAFFCEKKHQVKGLAFFSFFVVALFVYYAISPGLYGLGKYQAEYVIPFAIVGSFMIIEKLIPIINKRTVVFLLSFVIWFNIAMYYKIASMNKPVDVLVDTIGHDATNYDSGYHILCGFPYEFDQAYNEIKALGLTNNSYTIGVTYGVFLEIVNGYTMGAVTNAESIYRLQRDFNMLTKYDLSSAAVVKNVEKDARIKVVVLGATYKKDELINEFNRHGWVKHSVYKNVEYGSSVTIMKKITI